MAVFGKRNKGADADVRDEKKQLDAEQAARLLPLLAGLLAVFGL